jgi:NAD(P)-dependent dehydrogenase (short-subunit alcohol dehydrogenase family)
MSTTQRFALVTGAGSGIGQSAALAMLQDGFKVIICGRNKTTLETTMNLAGDKASEAIAIQTDIRRPAEVEAMFATIRETFGRLDLLFNNAGISAPAVPLEDISYEDWQSVIESNLTGAFLCTREAFKIMKSQAPMGGRIINNGSISAHVPRPNSAPYTASKHAITGLTKSTSLDGRNYNICCVQIDIGNADTSMAGKMKEGILQPNGSVIKEPTIDTSYIAETIVYLANLPLDVNVPFITVMANRMPYMGRG